MPRQNRRRSDQAPVGSGTRSVQRRELWGSEEYVVRLVSGTPGRNYRCPGCDQLVASSAGHVVAWPASDLEAVDRRHWHSACWAARGRRTPALQRSRSAPRH